MKTEEKLRVNEVEILTPGQQVKNIILEKYNSLDDFADIIGIYTGSLKQYLRSRKVGSGTFKIKLTQALGMSYNEIVKSNEEQIATYVNSVSNNMRMYNKKEDFKVLEKLRDICIEYKLIKELAMIFRNFGRYYIGKNEMDKAIDNMKISINYLKNIDNKEYLIKYMSELACHYVTAGNQEEAEKLLPHVEKMLKRYDYISPETKSAIYHNLGVSYIRINEVELGIKHLKKSINYVSSRNICQTVIAIGLAYKMDKKYDLALKYYNQALQVIEEDNGYIYTLYNNIADLYKEMKEYTMACYYIEKIFEKLEGDTLFIMNKFFHTFSEIKMEMGKENDILEKLNEMIQKENLEYIYTSHFIDSINFIINLGQNNSLFLNKLKRILINIIKKRKIEDEKIIDQLKKYIGEIVLLQDQNNI